MSEQPQTFVGRQTSSGQLGGNSRPRMASRQAARLLKGLLPAPSLPSPTPLLSRHPAISFASTSPSTQLYHSVIPLSYTTQLYHSAIPLQPNTLSIPLQLYHSSYTTPAQHSSYTQPSQAFAYLYPAQRFPRVGRIFSRRVAFIQTPLTR